MMGCRIRTNRVAKWPFVFCLPLSFFEFVRRKELSLLPNSQSTMMTVSTRLLLRIPRSIRQKCGWDVSVYHIHVNGLIQSGPLSLFAFAFLDRI